MTPTRVIVKGSMLSWSVTAMCCDYLPPTTHLTVLLRSLLQRMTTSFVDNGSKSQNSKRGLAIHSICRVGTDAEEIDLKCFFSAVYDDYCLQQIRICWQTETCWIRAVSSRALRVSNQLRKSLVLSGTVEGDNCARLSV